MPTQASPVRGAAASAPPVPMSSWSSGDAAVLPSQADLCERAVQAIWRSLDRHDLVDEHVRDELAAILDPLTGLPLGNRPQRLIGVLRERNPLDPSHLYWLTRRLLTLVPELQAIEHALDEPAVAVRRDTPIDAIGTFQSLD